MNKEQVMKETISYEEWVVWRLKNHENLTLESFFGKKAKHIKKGFEQMDAENIKYETLPLTKEDLYRFYHSLYLPNISSKQNAEVFDIIPALEKKIQEDHEIYISKIEQDEHLLWAGIFIVKNNKIFWKTLSAAYRVDTGDCQIQWRRVWNYIEALYFLKGKELKVDYFSKGQDRNGYGQFGANIGVALHKLEMNFLPMNAKTINFKTQEKPIKIPTLVFHTPNEKRYFQEATLFASEYYPDRKWIIKSFEKKGIRLHLF